MRTPTEHETALKLLDGIQTYLDPVCAADLRAELATSDPDTDPLITVGTAALRRAFALLEPWTGADHYAEYCRLYLRYRDVADAPYGAPRRADLITDLDFYDFGATAETSQQTIDRIRDITDTERQRLYDTVNALYRAAADAL